ncbi:MAG: hypothetical protein J6R82_00430, partial [Clostridia bacterium]|nr:hypothetical protein [Clostridia bacterium]
MKPYYLLALLALLILASCLAACRQEPAVTSVTTPSPSPTTTVNVTTTPHRTSISYPDVSGSVPSTEMTTPLVPVISTA